MWGLRKCDCNLDNSGRGDTLSVKVDTVYVKADTVIKYIPQPYRVEYRDSVILHDTLETFETITQQIDTSRVVNQYFATRYYDDTKQVKYGEVTIFDTVSQNRIIGRSIFVDQDIPVVTKTVTLSQPKRMVGYIGIIGIGNKHYLPYASGLTFDLKLKNDFTIGTGALITQEQPMYLLTLRVPIRFRKH